MFHLIIYTEESVNSLEKCLTLFENIYNRDGVKVQKQRNSTFQDNTEMEDSYLFKEKIEEKKIKEKECAQLKYQLYLSKEKINYFTSTFVELYINHSENFDLYLIEENDCAIIQGENVDGGTKCSGKCNDKVNTMQERKVTEGGERRDRRERREKKIGKDEASVLNDGSPPVAINLPLHRSHMLFVLSLPSYFSIYDFFSLIYEYLDFIVRLKVFCIKSNFAFLRKRYRKRGSPSKRVRGEKVVGVEAKDRVEEGDEAKDRAEEGEEAKDRAEEADEAKDRAEEGEEAKDRAEEGEEAKDRAEEADEAKDRAEEETNRRKKPSHESHNREYVILGKNKKEKKKKHFREHPDSIQHPQVQCTQEEANPFDNFEDNTDKTLHDICNPLVSAHHEEGKNKRRHSNHKKEKKKTSHRNGETDANRVNEGDYKEENKYSRKHYRKSARCKKGSPVNSITGKVITPVPISRSSNATWRKRFVKSPHEYTNAQSECIVSSCTSASSPYCSSSSLNTSSKGISKKRGMKEEQNKLVRRTSRSGERNEGDIHRAHHKRSPTKVYTDERLLFYQKMYGVLKKKLKKKKKIESYSVLIIFKTQTYADMFYKKYHCTNLDFFMREKRLGLDMEHSFYEHWYVYCVFVNLIYYIVDTNNGEEQMYPNAYTNHESVIEGLSSCTKKDSFLSNMDSDKKFHRSVCSCENTLIPMWETDGKDNQYGEEKEKNVVKKSNKMSKIYEEKLVKGWKEQISFLEKEKDENIIKEIDWMAKNYTITHFDINNYENFFKSIIIDCNMCISTCLLCLERLGSEMYFILTRNKKWNIIKKKNDNHYDYINLSCNVCTMIFFYDIVHKLVNDYFGTISGDIFTKDDELSVMLNRFFRVYSPLQREGNKCARDEVAHGEVIQKEGNVHQLRGKEEKSELEDIPNRTEETTMNNKIKRKKRLIERIIKIHEIIVFLKCKHCNNVDDIWLCLICSNIGCGRYQKSHAKTHSSKFNHNYCINLKTKKIWNYLQDTFVEGRIVEQVVESDEKISGSYPYRDDVRNYVNEVQFDLYEEEELFDNPPNFEYSGLYDYNSYIYDKVFDIFTNDVYINDNLKNELLYILYSQLSHESNIYNNTLIELQYKYLNKVDKKKKKSSKYIQEKINEIKNQNNKMEKYILHLDNLIKIKNCEKTQIQEKIKFFRDLNNNIILQKKNDKNKLATGEENNDSRKIKRLDETIKTLQGQIDTMLSDL
ncbi:zinc finger protein, putative [Plasmodium ovale wallikeri]|uniref:Zinc finger protein, putative n=1 Tax=Plasmodium ovale wallikeri TaxID=864142 RepID=A0A1A8YKA4_PLAOA|nr:zinc finger protein, putative [Plasmodium ovale wallikeri]